MPEGIVKQLFGLFNLKIYILDNNIEKNRWFNTFKLLKIIFATLLG